MRCFSDAWGMQHAMQEDHLGSALPLLYQVLVHESSKMASSQHLLAASQRKGKGLANDALACPIGANHRD